MSVDIVIINADVHALDEASYSFEAVGIDDGKIAFLGSNGAAKKIADSKTHVIDARGRVVLPGFIDVHTHFTYMGVREGYWTYPILHPSTKPYQGSRNSSARKHLTNGSSVRDGMRATGATATST